MIRRPAARSARPVSVMSTMQSAMSGILASLAPYDSRTSASMPFAAKNRAVSSGYSTGDPHALRQVLDALRRRVAGDRDDHLDRVRRGLRVPQLAQADDVAGGLLDPVAPGDADVEQPLGHVRRDLLRAQDAHLGDPRVVDGRLVVDRRRADDRQVGRLEQLERRLLQRALGQHEPAARAARLSPVDRDWSVGGR